MQPTWGDWKRWSYQYYACGVAIGLVNPIGFVWRSPGRFPAAMVTQSPQIVGQFGIVINIDTVILRRRCLVYRPWLFLGAYNLNAITIDKPDGFSIKFPFGLPEVPPPAAWAGWFPPPL